MEMHRLISNQMVISQRENASSTKEELTENYELILIHNEVD